MLNSRFSNAHAELARQMSTLNVAPVVLGLRRPPGQHWSNLLSLHVRYHKKREQKELDSRLMRTVEEVCMTEENRNLSSGDKRLADVNYWLTHLGVDRSPDQALFHEHFINACLPKIVGELEWNENSVRIMESRSLSKIAYEVVAVCPRRWGKTWAVALFVLALMLAVPGIRICVFSTGKRASGSLMEIVTTMMNNRSELASRKVKENQEELYLSGAPLDSGSSSNGYAAKQQRSSPLTSKLLCFPCSVTGQ